MLLLLCQPVLHLVETAKQREKKKGEREESEWKGERKKREKERRKVRVEKEATLNKLFNSALRYACCGMLHIDQSS